MDDGWLDIALPCIIYIENLDLIASDNSLLFRAGFYDGKQGSHCHKTEDWVT